MHRTWFLSVFCMVFSLMAASYEGKVGLDFSVAGQSTVGLKWHISRNYCLNPFLGLYSSDNKDDFNCEIGIGNQLYLLSFPQLDNYVDFRPSVVVQGTKKHLKGAVSYGVQHQFNSAVSLFGEMGIEFQTPDYHIGTFRSGVGAVFYFN